MAALLKEVRTGVGEVRGYCIATECAGLFVAGAWPVSRGRLVVLASPLLRRCHCYSMKLCGMGLGPAWDLFSDVLISLRCEKKSLSLSHGN